VTAPAVAAEPSAPDALAAWQAWQDACNALWEERRRWGYATSSREGRYALAPLEAKRDRARATFDALSPFAQHVGACGGVPYASPYGAVPAGASIDEVNDWVISWWPDAVAHRGAVEEAMTAFGFYVARRIARGWSAIEAP